MVVIKFDQQNHQKSSKNHETSEIFQNPKWAEISAEIRSGPLVFDKCENGWGCAIFSAYRMSCSQQPARWWICEAMDL